MVITLKPENLIAINKDNKFTEIKIVDFGLAEDISTNPGFIIYNDCFLEKCHKDTFCTF